MKHDAIGTVHCDSCGHDIHDQVLKDWFMKDCPKCGAPSIVNDDDMAVVKMIEEGIELGLLTQDKTVQSGISIHLDTAGMRAK